LLINGEITPPCGTPFFLVAFRITTGSITARTTLFIRGTEIESVHGPPELTIYARFGDVVAKLAFILMIAGLVIAIVRSRRQPKTSPNGLESWLLTNGRSGRHADRLH
jgi:hypothetical protein